MNNLTLLNDNHNINQNIYFSIGKNKYTLPILNVLEVMDLPQLDYPQKLPSNFIGILKYNNLTINVLDIRFYLDIEITPYSTSDKLIIVKTDETIFAIIVDKIEDVINFENNKTEHLPFTSDNKFIDSVYKINKETIFVLNAYALENVIRNGYPEKNIDVCSLFPTDKTSVDILQNRAILLLKKNNLTAISKVFSDTKFVAFSLNNTTYCANLNYIKEFCNSKDIIPLPCTAEYILGIITIKGDFITVVDLKKFLNLSDTNYSNKSKVIIINSSNVKLGFLVDDVYEIFSVNEDTINNIEYSENEFITSEIIENNTVKPILNIEKIISDERLFINEE